MVEQGIGTLDVFVFSAAGMVKMDLRGLCDPYVTVTIANSDGVGGKTKRTKYIRQNLNPEFNDAFSFPVHSLAQMLVVSWRLLACKRARCSAAACSPRRPFHPRWTHDGADQGVRPRRPGRRRSHGRTVRPNARTRRAGLAGA